MRGKRILLGITGGIAAYKIAYLIRLLKKSEAEVKCVMTPSAVDFVSPLVLSTLSGSPVGIEFWNKEDGTWTNHVEYGLWADVFVIAPATANTLSKMSSGSADNLLLATFLSMKAKTLVAPAMDLDMYTHSTTKRNLDILLNDGVVIIPAEEGELASGLVGEGRMAEPESIFNAIRAELETQSFDGVHALVTAGPTYESIDPVRFIGNHSSGKMGYSIARGLLAQGAKVTLISGPVNQSLFDPNLNIINITSAEEMYTAVKSEWSNCTLGIFTAAVADYRPKNTYDQKLKKENTSDVMTVELVKNPDILEWAGQNKSEEQLLVGFALETENLEQNAKSKLQRKNLDVIVMNTLEDKGAGFGSEKNKISILDKHNNFTSFELKPKDAVAEDILNFLKTIKE